MIRDWAKSSLGKLALGAIILAALLCSVVTAGALDTTVNPSSITADFAFNQPKDVAHYEAQRTITIRNTNPDPNSTISGSIGSISGDISITPNYGSFLLHGGESLSVILTIVAAPSAAEGTHPVTLNVGEEHVSVTVTVTYYARIEVSPSSLDFGRVRRTDNPSATVRFSEKYGYKDVTVNLARSGNSWVTGPTSVLVPRGGYKDATFLLTPGYPDRNEYSWTFSLSTTASHTTISPGSIYLEAYLLLPAKLGRLYDAELELTFDKPKGTVSSYSREIEVRVRNDGDETMQVSSSFVEAPGGGISLTILESPGEVAGKSSKSIRLRIVAPYNAPEGTYTAKLSVDAGDAGRGTVSITIVLKWPVDFSFAPTSLEFGTIELQERGYETKEVAITLTELYRYKPVQNLRFSKTGEYGNWLKEELDFTEIPPGESRTVTIKLEPGLEAVPEDYVWTYAISATEIAAKRMEVTAKIVPLNITKLMDGFRSYRESPLYRSYPSTESLIANGLEMLEVVERSEIGAEDWQKIPVLMTGTLSLLSSLNSGLVFTEAKSYGSAVESLSAASVSTATIASNAQLNNGDLAEYATSISTDAGTTTEAVLRDEATLLELRGWTLKKAVEYALAVNETGGLQEEENVLDAALSYHYAATLYGLLNDRVKRLENVYEGDRLMDKHDELVSDATDLRIRAETSVATSKENDLSRIGDWYLLVNPYNYDTFVTSYRTAVSYLEAAAEKYKVAGERFLYQQTRVEVEELQSELSSILILFFTACSFYGLLFGFALLRITRGTIAYLRDLAEREVGELLVSG
jgi:hypothetical protein